jgi:hypothetical protein
VDLLVTGDHEKGRPLSEQDGLLVSLARLQALVARAQNYVEGVLVGGV